MEFEEGGSDGVWEPDASHENAGGMLNKHFQAERQQCDDSTDRARQGFGRRITMCKQ